MVEGLKDLKPKRVVVRAEHRVILDRALGLRLKQYVEREWAGDRRVTGAIFRRALKEFLDRQDGQRPDGPGGEAS